MENEEIILCNLCTDLVSLKKSEAFPLRLLEDSQPGEWVSVRELCQRSGLDARELKPDLFAAWLPDPANNADYVVILFYDDESKWTLAAHYNRARLVEAAKT